MERTEAIEWLKSIKEKYIHGGDDFYDYQRRTAIDYAVAMLERRTGITSFISATCKLGAKGCWDDARCRARNECKFKITSNADRIRAMSDEELCSVVRLAAYADICYMSCECHKCVFHGLCKEDEDEMYSDEQEEITAVMKWLKQPAGEE